MAAGAGGALATCHVTVGSVTALWTVRQATEVAAPATAARCATAEAATGGAPGTRVLAGTVLEGMAPVGTALAAMAASAIGPWTDPPQAWAATAEEVVVAMLAAP